MKGITTLISNLYLLHQKLYAANSYYPLFILTAFGLTLFGGNWLKKLELKGDKDVKIILLAKVKANDRFSLYYLPGTEKEYSDKYLMKTTVHGNEDFQQIKFSLPDTIKLRKLRIDLGDNFLQKEVEIKMICLVYNDEQIQLFNGSEHVNYFEWSEFTTRVNEGRFILSPPKQQIYDPFIFSKDLSSEYMSLTQYKQTLSYPYLISFLAVFAALIYFLFYLKPAGFVSSFYAFASCFFIFILFLPSINENLGLYKNTNFEKRVLASRPVFSFERITAYPKQFESYYNDNFGFREALVKLGGKIKYKLFNSSGQPSKMLVGKEGWMFLSGNYDHVTQDLLKQNSYSRQTLELAVKEWEEKINMLARDSIKYYKALWPDKHYVYSEYLPFAMSVLNKDTLAKCDQLINYLKSTRSDLEVIDPRADLLRYKNTLKLYDKFDSHWNSHGAFIAYTVLLNKFHRDFKQLQPIPINKFTIQWNMAGMGDLSLILGLDLSELKPDFILQQDSADVQQLPVDGYPERTQIIENAKSITDLTILIYRDSFTTALIPFLSKHFRKMILISSASYSYEMVKKTNPDIVLEGYVTRYFR